MKTRRNRGSGEVPASEQRSWCAVLGALEGSAAVEGPGAPLSAGFGEAGREGEKRNEVIQDFLK